MIKSKSVWLVYLAPLRLLSKRMVFKAVLALAIGFQSARVYGLSPHDSVLQQNPMLLWTKILSDACIALACFALFPIAMNFTKRRKDTYHALLFWLLSILLLAFGALHLVKIWNLFHQLYWIMACIQACTAAIAVLATIAFWPLVPKVMALKGSEEFAKVNEKLHESEKHLHLLISGIKDYAIILLDPKGTVMTWNDGAERINGYKADEIIGKNFSCFFSPKDIEKGNPEWELNMAAKNGRYDGEALRVRKNGQSFWADVNVTALYDISGHLTGFSKVTRDITERKQALRALEEQAALFDLFSDAIIVRDLDGSISYWNAGAEKMYGYTKKEAIGQHIHKLLKTEFPKPLSKIEAHLFSHGAWNGEISQLTREGQRIIVDCRKSIKTDDHGKSIGIVEINTDITDRKQVEQKQSALNEMERVNAELEQFASVASHDLQEPLRAIAGCLQILERTYKGRLDKDADELIDYAIEGAQRMRTLINDLLSLSRVDHEEVTFLPTPIPEVIEQVKTNLAAAISESKATITYNGLPVLSANNTLLTQLFQNLIGNSIKFRGSNPPEINIDASHQNGHWLFSVRDNGIGFEQLYAERIFQPFKRLHSKDIYPGSGIGLPICKRIIEKHGGRIWAESQPGKGTTFNFTIKVG